jgi:hypothetical protein
VSSGATHENPRWTLDRRRQYHKFGSSSIYATRIDFIQRLLISPAECLLCEAAYCLPGNRHKMKHARYANCRINRAVNAEDTLLITHVQQGMQIGSCSNGSIGPISESEVSLRSFARKIRVLIPGARRAFALAPGWRTQ